MRLGSENIYETQSMFCKKPGPGGPDSFPMKNSLLRASCLVFLWAAAPFQAHSFTGMVSFGDSLSDVGNTVNLLTETEAQVLTGYNPNFYFTNRYSDGPVWVDTLYANLGFGDIGTIPRNNGVDVLNGTNFAWAAARSGTGNSFFLIPNLQPQVSFYTEQLAANNPALPNPATTLFTLWIGGNDVFAHVEDENDPITPLQVAANISTAITNLYNAGGRSFLIPNLPPIGLTPDYVNDPIKGPQATQFANAINLQVDQTLNALSGNLTGINIIKLDINGIFLDVTANRAAYGLSNVTEKAYTPFSGENPPYPYGSVVNNAGAYLYWDAAHGTTTVNALIAEAATAAVVPEPSSMALLLGSAVAALYYARKRNRKSNPISL